MRIIIVEDEEPAREQLEACAKRFDPSIEILAKLDSVRGTLGWLRDHRQPDLLFLDIQLSDGLSLEIFRQCKVTCPAIFSTAYDEYVLQAFACNGIDYLLKPLSQEKVAAALIKYRTLSEHFRPDYGAVFEAIAGGGSRRRDHWVARKGSDFAIVKTAEIAYISVEHKLVFVVDAKGARYWVDGSLSDLGSELDPKQFFRVSRQIIVAMSAIKRFRPIGKGQIELELGAPGLEPLVLSQERAAEFKKWVAR